MEKENVYEKPVTLTNIMKFAVPTIAMTVFMSFYTMVDGLFVSNLSLSLPSPIFFIMTALPPVASMVEIAVTS